MGVTLGVVVGVEVGDNEGVIDTVGVCVGVFEGVLVGVVVFVGVGVGVDVGVLVGVDVGDAVGVGDIHTIGNWPSPEALADTGIGSLLLCVANFQKPPVLPLSVGSKKAALYHSDIEGIQKLDPLFLVKLIPRLDPFISYAPDSVVVYN